MRKSVTEILEEVAAEYRMPLREMLSRSRTNRVTRPRFKAMYRIFTECPHISYPEMARRMGGFDHTTCLNGVRRYCALNGISYEIACALRKAPSSNSNHKRYGTIDALFAAYGKAMENARAVQ